MNTRLLYMTTIGIAQVACGEVALNELGMRDAAQNDAAPRDAGRVLYEVTVELEGDGSGVVRSTPDGIRCGDTCRASFEDESTVTLTASAAAGSTFIGWSNSSCDAEYECPISIDGDLAITATFERSKYLVQVTHRGIGIGTVTSDIEGINCGLDCIEDYFLGTTLVLTATATGRSIFGGWSGACTGLSNSCTITVEEMNLIEATFDSLDAPLTINTAGKGSRLISSQPEGIDCGPRCSAMFPLGTPVTLKATPLGGTTLEEWSGDCMSTTSTCSLIIDAEKTVTATFRAAPLIALGAIHSCAVNENGGLRCWGDGAFGQLGYGDTMDIGETEGDTPRAAGNVPVGGFVTQIATGGIHTCALLDMGRVRCWGDGEFGKLGYLSTESLGGSPSTIPELLNDVDIGGVATQIVAGDSHTCVLLATGKVRCWGWAITGQLGYGNRDTIGDDEAPARAGDVPIGGTVIQLSSGFSHVCALLDSSKVRCWGDNSMGQLGYGSVFPVGTSADNTPELVGDVPVGGNVVQISAAGAHTCALLDTGGVKCWGEKDFGILGYGNLDEVGTTPMNTPDLIGEVPIGGPVREIAGGLGHTCAILRGSNSLRCWGVNDRGQLGYGNTSNIGETSTTLPESAGNVSVGGAVERVRCGLFHTCAVRMNAAIYCWGGNADGQLGYGNVDPVGTDSGNLPSFAGAVTVF